MVAGIGTAFVTEGRCEKLHGGGGCNLRFGCVQGLVPFGSAQQSLGR